MEDCFDRTANVLLNEFIGCCLCILHFADLKSSALKDNDSLNMLDFSKQSPYTTKHLGNKVQLNNNNEAYNDQQNSQ